MVLTAALLRVCLDVACLHLFVYLLKLLPIHNQCVIVFMSICVCVCVTRGKHASVAAQI